MRAIRSRARFSRSTSIRLEHQRNLPVLQTSESSFCGLIQGLRRGRLQPWLGNWSARLGLRKRHLPCVANVDPGLLFGPFHPHKNPSRRCLTGQISAISKVRGQRSKLSRGSRAYPPTSRPSRRSVIASRLSEDRSVNAKREPDVGFPFSDSIIRVVIGTNRSSSRCVCLAGRGEAQASDMSAFG